MKPATFLKTSLRPTGSSDSTDRSLKKLKLIKKNDYGNITRTLFKYCRLTTIIGPPKLPGLLMAHCNYRENTELVIKYC